MAETEQHQEEVQKKEERILTIRLHSGLSGDMLMAGLFMMADLTEDVDQIVRAVLPSLSGSVRLERRFVSHIAGWHAAVDLPMAHEHRSLPDINEIIEASGMEEAAKALAKEAFALLAKAEGSVHGIAPEEVHFHEVGALDSILDICVSCELVSRLHLDRIVVSPLPLADGSVACAHGILPTPAPAVIALMPGMHVCSNQAHGETVTPTAVALLKVFGAKFGGWPEMRVERTAIVYGTKVFPDQANGATFAYGTGFSYGQCSI